MDILKVVAVRVGENGVRPGIVIGVRPGPPEYKHPLLNLAVCWPETWVPSPDAATIGRLDGIPNTADDPTSHHRWEYSADYATSLLTWAPTPVAATVLGRTDLPEQPGTPTDAAPVVLPEPGSV